ncbi:MAG: glycosyltransferase family 9 protein [Sediminibacterium sp.]|nr:glycosyltransferase family 9 protein [Sediminibacterium sp.]
MKKILVIQTAFLGDAILASSVLETIHSVDSTIKLAILVKHGNETIFDNHPFLHNVFIWKKQNKKYVNLFSLILKIRKEKYDVVINLQRFFSAGLITIFSNATIKLGFKKNPLQVFFTKSFEHSLNNIHEINRNGVFSKYLFGNNLIIKYPQLYPTEDNFNAIKIYQTKPYICIAPNSVWFTKQLPGYKWIELINELSPFNIYLIGGKSDYAYNQQIVQKSIHTSIINLSGKLTILETAALMKNATLNYVNDSAPLHLASSTNANVVAVYCSTIPEFGFSPLSSKQWIVQIKLPCKPCGLHGKKKCPLNHFNCANDITIKELLIPLQSIK